MADHPILDLSSTVLGAPDPRVLMAFYRDLLGWQVRVERADWAVLTAPGGGAGLSFQVESDHVAPSWPAGAGDQQMQVHLDIEVDDLSAGVARAVMLGATLAQHQPQHDVRVLVDPAGHPFCLFSPGGAAG